MRCTTWSTHEPPDVVFLLQWKHEEFSHNGKPDVRWMQLLCDAASLEVEKRHLDRRNVPYKVWTFAKHEIKVRTIWDGAV